MCSAESGVLQALVIFTFLVPHCRSNSSACQPVPDSHYTAVAIGGLPCPSLTGCSD